MSVCFEVLRESTRVYLLSLKKARLVPRTVSFPVRSILSNTAQGPFPALFVANKNFLMLGKDAKYPDFRIVLILMKGGTRMRQHRAEGRISIQQLKGQVRIHLADREVTLSTGHLLMLDCGVLHDVEAREESALLLTISWRREKSDASESLSSTQRHLDEEALSRMDDEGGVHGATVTPPGTARKTVSGG